MRLYLREAGGISFLRKDLPDPIEIPATIAAAVAGERNTILSRNGQAVQTVEHLLSALFGLGIRHALIELDGPEVAIMDGSALAFIKALQPEHMKIKREALPTPIVYQSGKAHLMAIPAEKLTFTYLLDYKDHPMLPSAVVGWSGDPVEYAEKIAPARTFCLYEEALFMQKAGLIKGGDLDSAVLVARDHYIAAGGLRFFDEPARHKLLDLIGDLSLISLPACHIIAVRSGHRSHLEFAKRLGGYCE